MHNAFNVEFTSCRRKFRTHNLVTWLLLNVCLRMLTAENHTTTRHKHRICGTNTSLVCALFSLCRHITSIVISTVALFARFMFGNRNMTTWNIHYKLGHSGNGRFPHRKALCWRFLCFSSPNRHTFTWKVYAGRSMKIILQARAKKL
jgi:hypothetical protein